MKQWSNQLCSKPWAWILSSLLTYCQNNCTSISFRGSTELNCTMSLKTQYHATESLNCRLLVTLVTFHREGRWWSKEACADVNCLFSVQNVSLHYKEYYIIYNNTSEHKGGLLIGRNHSWKWFCLQLLRQLVVQ